MNRLLVAAATVCFVFSLTVNAQTSATAAPAPEISPEKRALAKELSEAMGMKQQASELLTAMENELSKQMVEITWQALSAMPEMKVLTESERQDLQTQLREDSARQTTRVLGAITKRVDYGQLLEDVTIAIYSKYYNEKELKDLISFYKSDTGRRSIELAPKLIAESMSEAGNRLMPVMEDVMRDVAADDTNKFRDRVAELAKAHHRQTTSKRKSR